MRTRTILDNPKLWFGFEFGKPCFPSISESTRLADLVKEDSWWTAKILNLQLDFLDLDASQWDKNDSYIASKKIVDNLVNDFAERAVKLTSDFAQAACEEGHFHNTQVVSADRKAKPNLRRKKKAKKL